MEEEEFMSDEEYAAELENGPKDELSEDAKRVQRGMTSATGVEFAPWMKVDAEKIAQAKKEREARKQRMANQRADELQMDPQAAELSGTGGIKSKVLSEEEVELAWDTADEAGNKGFIVQRRRGGEANFADLDSFDDFAPLRTKGPAGGSYRYLDDTAGVGTWVYRIVAVDDQGQKAAICQKLVEIDSQAEKSQTLIVGGLAASIFVVGAVLGTLADPIQTTSGGSGGFALFGVSGKEEPEEAGSP
jgi:hypothetical protein